MNSYIVGQSPHRATLFLHHLLTDIHAGRKVLCIDPYGHLTTKLLPYLPRQADVVLFDEPIPWNPLSGPEHPAVITDQIITVIKDIAGYDLHGSPQMDLYLRHSLHVLIKTKEPLSKLDDFLLYKDYRDELLARFSHPKYSRFWQHYDTTFKTGEKQMMQINSAFNKANDFSLDERLTDIIGHAQSGFRNSTPVVIARLPMARLGRPFVRTLALLLLARLGPSHTAYVYDADLFAGSTLTNLLITAKAVLSDTAPQKHFLRYVTDRYVFRVSLSDISLLIDSHAVGHKDLTALPDTTYRHYPPDNSRNLTVPDFPWPRYSSLPDRIRRAMRELYLRHS